MSSGIGKSSKSIFVTLFIGVIVVSFLFTGYESMRGAPDAIGTVGSQQIKISEYQNEIERQTQFFSSLYNGGEALTQKQIQELGLKDSALRNLVNKKLTVILSEKLGVVPSLEQTKEEIKSLPYFQTNGSFDIERYKALLAANRLTPTDFENEVNEQIKVQNAQAFFTTFPLSNTFIKERHAFRSQVIDASAIEISRTQIEKAIPVSASEIKEFLSNEANAKRVESAFNERKPMLDQKEQVKASHILITTETRSEEEAKKLAEDLRKKITRANFKTLAEQNTEDPSGKGNGGALNWFGKGLMDPAFEKVAFEQKPGTISQPVKSSFGYHIILTEEYRPEKLAVLADHSNEIAKEFIQKTKVEDRDKLIADVKEQAQLAISQGNTKAVKALADKYKLTFEEKMSLNRLEGAMSNVTVQATELNEIFTNGLDQNQTYLFDRPASILVLKTSKVATPVAPLAGEALNEDKRGLGNALARKLNQEVVDKLQAQTKVRIQTSMLNF